MSAPYLDGATIDFADTIEKQGFTIDNPNAGSSLRLRRQLQLIRRARERTAATGPCRHRHGPSRRAAGLGRRESRRCRGRTPCRGRFVAVQIAVTGSIATDHLMTFDGQLRRLARRRAARQDLAVLPRRRPRGPPRRRGRQHRASAWPTSASGRSSSARSARTSPTTAPGSSGTASTAGRCTSPRRGTPPASSARPTTTMAQIASFYAGAMSEARDDRARRRSPTGRRARPRRSSAPTTPRRCCATPRSAARAASRSSPTRRSSSPSATAPSSARLIDGADYLFTNEYESHLTETEDRLEPGTRSSTGSAPRSSPAARTAPHPHARARSRSRCRSAREVAQGRPHRRRRRLPGRLPRRPRWWARHERCAEVGSMLAAYVIETVGTQEYVVTRSGFLDRFADGLRRRRRRRDRAARALRRAPDPRRRRRDWSTRRSSRPRTPWRLDSARPTRARTSSAVGADLEPGTLLAAYRARPVPDGARRRTARRRSAGGRRTRAACIPPGGLRVSRSLRKAVAPLRGAGRHRLRRGRRGAAPTPAREGRWITPEIAARLRRLHDARLGALRRDLAGRRARRRPLRRGDRRPVRGGVDVPHGARRLQGGAGRARRASSTPTATRAGWSTCSGPPTTWPRWGARGVAARGVPRRPRRGPARRLRSTLSGLSRGRRAAAPSTTRYCGPAVVLVQRHACAPASGTRPARRTRRRRRRRAARRWPRWQVAGSAGQPDDRAPGSAVPRASTTGRSGHRSGRPELRRRTAATASGSSRQSRSTSASRVRGDRLRAGSVTRTLPWVSTPIAASTWLGRACSRCRPTPTPRRSRAGRAPRAAPRRRRRAR